MVWNLLFAQETHATLTMETGVKTLVPPDNPKRKNPWGVAPTLTSTPCSLAAVMDEQLARELQDEEEDIYKWLQELC